MLSLIVARSVVGYLAVLSACRFREASNVSFSSLLIRLQDSVSLSGYFARFSVLEHQAVVKFNVAGPSVVLTLGRILSLC